jgi:putative lipoprotein
MRFTSMVVLLLFVASSASGASVTGTASYRERIAMPHDARFEATLEEVSRADARAEVVARTKLDSPGNPPIHFKINYPASQIQESHSYSVRARILVNGRLWMTSDESYPVITHGHDSDVTIRLRQVSSDHGSSSHHGSNHPATLDGPEWRLVRLGGRVVNLSSSERRPHITFDKNDHRVSGSGGCNRLTGEYHKNGGQIRFGQMAVTKMACLDGMETEGQFLKVLEQARSYRIVGDQLELFDFSRNSVATFKARER